MTDPAVTGPDLSGKSVLVTGGGSGIGEACARAFAHLGANVTVADVNAQAAERVAADTGGTPWVVDLSDTRALEELSLDVDILINNAGIQRINPIQDYDPGTFRLVHRLMVESPFLLIRAVLPGMYQRGFGRIINISSVHGLRASAYKSAYVSAKHALEGLSKVAAMEGGPHGVTSNCISPAYVRTALVEAQIADQARIHSIPEDEVVASVMLTESAVKRLVEPEEVASLAAWLAGPHAGMVTGASYPMDGGWSAR